MLTPACLNSERALLIWSAEKEVACFSTSEFYKVLSILKSIVQNSVELSVRLVELRQDLGLSRDNLAAKLDISHATLWRLENGQSSPTVELLAKMEAAGLDVTYLLSGTRSNCVSRVDDDEAWGRAAQAVTKAIAKHGLSPSPATYWRMVRLLYNEVINEGDLKRDIAQVLEKAGQLAAKP
ncbi:helix-turn-helix domain-containing protein [Hydrogenophaga sp. UC242_50]|uniref:helix-turn-helix domain-containing protein n=1 Tax=unclassified Hydrogenophaga TaxID=2610897 RepID=UPI0036D20CB5